MATSTTIPVTIEPEAADQIAAWGLEQPFRQMIEHARETIPGLRRIEVEFCYKVDEPDHPTIHLLMIQVSSSMEAQLDQEEQWRLWAYRTFPPDVLMRLFADIMDDQS